MIRSIAAFASLLLAAVPLLAQSPDKEPAQQDAQITVRAAPMPVLDGKIGEDEWAGGTEFELARGEHRFGVARVLRHKRQLLIGFKSGKYPAYALGFTFDFTDPVSRRRVLVRVTPIDPPMPPIAIFTQVAGRSAEEVPAAACDVRFDLTVLDQFSFELRLPLDVLEIARSEKGYYFTAQIWDLQRNKPLAMFPVVGEGAMQSPGVARLVPQGDWGATVPVDTGPPPEQPALAILNQAMADFRDGPGKLVKPHAGDHDGRRKDAPLAAAEKRLRELVATYPDYLSLRANLMRVLRARNDFEGALEILDSIPRDFPIMRVSARNAFVRLELLFSLGRFQAGLDHMDRNVEALQTEKQAPAMAAMLRRLVHDWKIEQEIRKDEAGRNDLPRVRFKTGKGDIEFELYEDDAPNGVANFISLIEAGAYDGTRFHWASGGTRVMGGDPNSRNEDPNDDGFGDPGYLIECDPGQRAQFHYTLAFVDKRNQRRSEGSSFVIHIAPLPYVDSFNTVLGRVIAGHDVVRKLEYYDTLEKATVVRKRNHEYKPVRRP